MPHVVATREAGASGGEAMVDERKGRPRARRWAPTGAAVLVVLGIGLFGTAVAQSHDELRQLRYWLPVAWVQQASTLDPPTFPWRVPFASPWDTPTHVLLPALAVDVLVVLTLVVAARWGLAAVARRVRERVGGRA